MAIDIGDTAKLTCDFTVSGVLTDPGSVVCRVKAPSGVVTVYTFGSSAELTKASVGKYVCRPPVTAAGLWEYRWEGTSPAKGAEEGQFYVTPQRVT